MIFSWFRRRRRRRILAQPMSYKWTQYMEKLPFYYRLTDEEQSKLHEIVKVMVAEKNWMGGRGVDVTDEMKVSVATQAGHLILHRDHDYYHNVKTIVMHPSGYDVPHGGRSTDGRYVDPAERLGEAWLRGPVVLAWNHVKRGARREHDGRNLVYHEFAHKLDMQDGVVDGTPKVDREKRLRWYRVMTEEYERHVEQSRRGRAMLLDDYGATNPAEFFAVATECFFELGLVLEEAHPDLYKVLVDFYKQDPARR